MSDWQKNLLEDSDRIRDLLTSAKRVAVLGIKPETHSDKPAHRVPRYLQQHGYEIIPVPVYYPEVDRILGEPVVRRLAEIPGPVDIVDVFRRPEDIPGHVPDLLEKRPKAVWLQLGIRNDEAARELAQAGIQVVQDRCMKVEHARLVNGAR